jgi:hypothetical protein
LRSSRWRQAAAAMEKLGYLTLPSVVT